jgi:hypothetical protein
MSSEVFLNGNVEFVLLFLIDLLNVFFLSGRQPDSQKHFQFT